jgi:hypothetical protein
MIYPGIDLYHVMVLEVERKRQKRLNEYLRQAAARGETKDKFGQKIACWLGSQMITWGSKLQNINTVPHAEIAINTRLTR